MSAVYDNYVPDLVEWLSITGKLTIDGEDIGDCTIRYPLNDNTESMEICESREDAVRIAQARWNHYTEFDKKGGCIRESKHGSSGRGWRSGRHGRVCVVGFQGSVRMIYSAHIREEFSDGDVNDGMGFVIDGERPDGGRVFLVKNKDGIWSALFAGYVDFQRYDARSDTAVYELAGRTSCTVYVRNADSIPELKGEEYDLTNVLALARSWDTNPTELDRLFGPMMERLGWKMTEDGMREG